MGKLFLFLSGVLFACSLNAEIVSEAEAEAIGIEAYIYGYPLVTMDMTRQVMTNVASHEEVKAPMGQFANARVYPNASFKDVTAPNADTLYSVAWLNLKEGPYVLHVPDEDGRYYLLPMLSGWTDVFADPGTRTTGTKAADFLITGPNWKGALPSGMSEFKSPTNMVWIIGRTYCTGTLEDYEKVHVIQNQYSLTPLSNYGKPYTPPKGTFDPSIDMKTPVRDQVNRLDAHLFFNKLAQLMVENPPTLEDAPMIAKMAKIGLKPGEPFNQDPRLERVPKKAFEKIMSHLKEAGKVVNGWIISLDMGRYGTDYLQRALVTAIGLGANLSQDAIYPYAGVDELGAPLNGKNNYKIHFEKGETPPVNGFWSLTMYDEHYFFVENPLNRYTLSPRDALKYNADGSLDLYIQHSSPGKDMESNWLPAPQEGFILMLRNYWPKESLLNGTWKPPAVKAL